MAPRRAQCLASSPCRVIIVSAIQGEVMKNIRFAVALLIASVSAPVAAQSYDSAASIRSFTENSVQPVLAELNAQITGRDKVNDLQRISFKFANGFVADMLMTACLKDGRCVGARIEARWDRDAKFTTQSDEAFTAFFNKQYDFTKSGVDANGKLFIQRYVIADRGIQQGVLYDELLNFQGLTKIFDKSQADRK
ncbi:MAG: hypothetical protein IPG54_00930 [Sphingomonadales bacterium]|nr:hypothetical protein [Sphingomonadales bacterium]MBK9268905.1 hypothetical protein [Sphingomonadales bacterium]